MKTIGLIGGMSWESTVEYYRILNEEVKARLGGLHSAKCILYSVDFDEIEHYQATDDWKNAARVLADAAASLERAGADFVVLCTNTMHKVAEEIQARVGIPLLHIADATAEEILTKKIKTIGLLGTKYTMEQDFYKSRLVEKGIGVVIPGEKDRAVLQRVIYEELCLGKILPESRHQFRGIINNLVGRGAEGIILGCTEIGLLVKPEDSEVSLFDTTRIHALKAVENALK
ncbi:MAG: aspartate/glutamate racemase family protein [Candidatus Aminicenantes bacterium]|nr:aspartate/glutamate racemase family protein [Candidatus Aminicenantes bacterium]